jgi:hypothetical protein
MFIHRFKLICVFVAFLSISFTTGFANGQSFPTSGDAVEAELPFWDYMQVAVLAEEGVSLEVIDDFAAARVSVFEHSEIPDFGYFAYLVPSSNGKYLRLVEGDIVPWSDEIEFHLHTLAPHTLEAPGEISDDYTGQSTNESRSLSVVASASGTTSGWVWWEGTKGFVAGLGQGVVNIGNGITDSAIGIANIPATAVNAIAWTEEQIGILDPGDSIRVPYIPAPDWSKDLVVPEDDFLHDASKVIGASGVELLSGVWVAKLAKADKAVDATKGSGAGTEVVERWMSKAELKATKETGLMRGGREGKHYVTDSANSTAKRARQRLALDRTPEVKVRLEVPTGTFSSPSRVKPAYTMPGGGMERTATGSIPVRVID